MESFSVDRNGVQCRGLVHQASLASAEACVRSCCDDPGCEVWQWCPHGAAPGDCFLPGTCWTGKAHDCDNYGEPAWVGGSRAVPTTVEVLRCPPHDVEVRNSSQPDAPALSHYHLGRVVATALLRRYHHRHGSRPDLQFVPLACFGKLAASTLPTPRLGRFTVAPADLCGARSDLAERLCCSRVPRGTLCVRPAEPFAVLSTEAPCKVLTWKVGEAAASVLSVVSPEGWRHSALQALQVPYPSSLSWNGRGLPQAPRPSRRNSLAALVASTGKLYNAGAEPLRRALKDECMRAGPAVCVLHSSDRAGAATAAYATGAYVAAYERAVFCLQPWGDTATRKGFYDAIAVGCIPVIFSRHGFESLEWMGVNLDELSILVPLANLTARGGALGYLSSLPRDKVVKLQASINSRRSLLQYGMRPGQPTRDAIDMLVSRVAKQLWRSARMARYAADNWPSWLPCDCKSFGWNRPQCATKIVAPGNPFVRLRNTKCVVLCTLNEWRN